jgi:hypothetical protein
MVDVDMSLTPPKVIGQEVCIVKNTMGVAWNNELEFQRPFEHHPF